MRGLKKYLLLFVMLFCIKVHADVIPEATLTSVMSDENVIEQTGGFYHLPKLNYSVDLNVNGSNENYCFFYTMYDNYESQHVICEYTNTISLNLNSESVIYPIRYGFIEKSKVTTYNDDSSEFKVSDIKNLKVALFYNDKKELMDKMFLSFENVTDSNGIVNPINQRYYFEEDKTYFINYKVTGNDDGLTSVRYDGYVEDYKTGSGEGFNGTSLISAGKVSIPFKLSSENPYLWPIMEVNIYFESENGNYIESSGELTVVNLNYRYFDVEVKYKNFDSQKIDFQNYTYNLDSRYYNKDNPLVFNITPKNFESENYDLTLEFNDSYEFKGQDEEWHHQEDNLYMTGVEVNSQGTIVLDTGNFVPNVISGEDGVEHYYNIRIKADGYEEEYRFIYSYGKMNSFVFAEGLPYTLYSGAGDGGENNYSGNEYLLSGFENKYVYDIFRGQNFDNNKTYKIQINRLYGENYNNSSSNLLYTKEVKGTELNNNYFFLKSAKDKYSKIIFKIFDDNDVLLYEKYAAVDRYLNSDNSNIIFFDGTNNIRKTLSDSLKYYFKVGSSNTLKVKAGKTYEEDKIYHYVVNSCGQNKVGEVSGKDLNTKILSIELNPFSRVEDFCLLEFSILEGAGDYSSIFITVLSNDDYSKKSSESTFEISDSNLNILSSKVGNNEVLFVNKSGKNVTKNVSYIVEYYKEETLTDTQTINEVIPYFEEEMDIDTNKVNLVNKYKGYKFKTTSKTGLDEETGKYFLHQIKDGETLKVYYEKDQVDYRVEYYYNGKIDNDLTYNSRALLDSSVDKYEPQAKTGYKLEKVETLPLKISEEENNNVIKVYYVTDPTQTKKITYKVEYYKDNVLADTQNIESTVQALENKTSVDKSKINTSNKYVGYKYKESNIPTIIEENGIIKVYYEKDSFKYYVEYYYNDEKLLTTSKTGLYKSVIDEYEDNMKAGYKLAKTEHFPLEISEKESNNIIKIYYKVDENNSEKVNISEIKLVKGDNNSLIINYDKSEYATGYKIYRSEKKTGKYKLITTTTNNKYTDTGLIYGKTYYYKVEAYNKVNNAVSNVVGMKVIPNKVANVKIISAGENNIKITWDKVPVTGYEVYMGKKKVSTIKKNGTITYNKTKLKANTKYSFKVRAYKLVKGKKVYGPFSEIINVITAPKKSSISLNVIDYKSLNVRLNSSKGATKYVLEMSTDKKTFKVLEELSSSGNYVKTDLIVGKTYYFRAKVCNNNNYCSSYSKVVSKKVVPAAPKIKVNSTVTKEVLINIEDQEGAIGYEIYRSTRKGRGYKKIATLTTKDSLNYTNVTSKGKTYYYKVRTYTDAGNKKVFSNYSSIKKIKSK